MFNSIKVACIAVRAALQSSGQNCAGAERFYVHRDIYSSFVSKVAKIVKSVSAVSIFLLTHYICKMILLVVWQLCCCNVMCGLWILTSY